MPELPEVEVTRRRLERAWTGQRLVGLELRDPRLAADAGQTLDEWCALLVGETLQPPQRRAKHLIVPTTGGHAMLIHLRMTGKMIDLDAQAEYGTHVRLVFALGNGARWAFQDTRRFGRFQVVAEEALAAHHELRRLGPDALLQPSDAARLAEICARTSRSIKALLMDQQAIGGIGNICATEILFRAGVAPARPADSLAREEIERLAAEIVPHLEWAIEKLTERRKLLYVNEPGATHPFPVYGRGGEPCPDCGALILRTVITGRSTFHCPVCQPDGNGPA